MKTLWQTSPVTINAERLDVQDNVDVVQDVSKENESTLNPVEV